MCVKYTCVCGVASVVWWNCGHFRNKQNSHGCELKRTACRAGVIKIATTCPQIMYDTTLSRLYYAVRSPPTVIVVGKFELAFSGLFSVVSWFEWKNDDAIRTIQGDINFTVISDSLNVQRGTWALSSDLAFWGFSRDKVKTKFDQYIWALADDIGWATHIHGFASPLKYLPRKHPTGDK